RGALMLAKRGPGSAEQAPAPVNEKFLVKNLVRHGWGAKGSDNISVACRPARALHVAPRRVANRRLQVVTQPPPSSRKVSKALPHDAQKKILGRIFRVATIPHQARKIASNRRRVTPQEALRIGKDELISGDPLDIGARLRFFAT